jgi:hypothetical protein
MSDQSTTERLDVMEIGYYDADDIAWLIMEFRRLRTIAADAIIDVCNANEYTLLLTDLAVVLADHGDLYPFDDLHHSPHCPANHWHKTLPPRGYCNCGAAYHARQRLGEM